MRRYKTPPIFEDQTFTVEHLAINERKARYWLVSQDRNLMVLLNQTDDKEIVYWQVYRDVGVIQKFTGRGDPTKDRSDNPIAFG